MPSIRTKFAVGLFVLIGMSVVVLFVFWLGMFQYLKEGRKYVAFFDESVQGLKEDSPVKYRGVAVGRVQSIGVAPDGNLVRIVINLDEPLKEIDYMVARLKAVGITGIMYVELERQRQGGVPIPPKLSFEPKYPVIPTRPSNIQQMLSDVSDIINNLKQIDFKGISESISETLNLTNQTLKEARVRQISDQVINTLENANAILDPEKWNKLNKMIQETGANANQLLSASRQTVSRIDQSVVRQSENLTRSLDEFQTAAKQASALLREIQSTVVTSNTQLDQFDQKIRSTMNQISSAAENLSGLIQELRNQPSSLLFSKPPPEKPIQPFQE